MHEQVSNQWFDWEDLDEEETECGKHGSPFHEGVGKPFGDPFLFGMIWKRKRCAGSKRWKTTWRLKGGEGPL